MISSTAALTLFQYQKGAIKTDSLRKEGWLLKYNFNTKKVRLKPLSAFCILGVTVSFQYQKGAIKTGEKVGEEVEIKHFNTKKVRLKHTHGIEGTYSEMAISIPKRCD